MKIYGDLGSGNCLKVKYTADQLGLAYTWVPVDTMKGETRTPEFLGRLPDGPHPRRRVRRRPPARRVQRHHPLSGARHRPAARRRASPRPRSTNGCSGSSTATSPTSRVCRFHMVYLGRPKEAREPWRVERGEAALDLMDRSLTGRDWLAGETMTDCGHRAAAVHAAGARGRLRPGGARQRPRLDRALRGCYWDWARHTADGDLNRDGRRWARSRASWSSTARTGTTGPWTSA